MKRWSTLFQFAFLRARLPGSRTVLRGIRTARRGRYERSRDPAKGHGAPESALDSACPGKGPFLYLPQSSFYFINSSSGSFISEGYDRIVTSGAEGGVDCAGRSSHQCKRDRGKNPGGGNQNRQARIRLFQNGLRQKSERDSQAGAHQRQDKG